MASTFLSSPIAHHIHIKKYYTLNARSVRVLRESSVPEPTTYNPSPPDPSNNVETLAISADDEFHKFTFKKRTESRTELTPEATDARSYTASDKDKAVPTCASKTSDKKLKKKQRNSDLEKLKLAELDKLPGSAIESDKPPISDIAMDTNV